MNGIVIIDKPSGITSFDVVKKIRHKFKIKKVGHCGTLDPLATGLLVVLLGSDTKLFSKFSAFDKAYLSTLKLGVATETGDCQGKIISECSVCDMPISQIEEVFNEFKGEINQIPPMFSALKHKGKKLYELARQGIEVPREKRSVKIIDLKISKIHIPYIDFYVHCSKGTYIRTLAHDIGAKLGCGACLTSLRRTMVGPFNIDEAVNMDSVDESHIRHWPS